MPKLILQFEGRVLKEFPMGQVVTIGRLPGNVIMIDNPAVSSKHARVVRDGDSYVIEDTDSTNGTFVNELRITKQTLKHGDSVLIGKHHLVFEEGAGEELDAPAEPVREVADLGGTVYLDTKRQKELLAQAQAKKAAAAGEAGTARMSKAPAASSAVGMLYVLAGKTDQTEYTLRAQTSLIGKSDTATVRLKGWFKPKSALAIARRGSIYTATPLGGKNLLNNVPLQGRQDLQDGDVLQVSGVTLEFRLVE
jgi:pSer/pThr/pTyr-binding forkhead associated (FHA) protein